jgi:hypothetical protein
MYPQRSGRSRSSTFEAPSLNASFPSARSCFIGRHRYEPGIGFRRAEMSLVLVIAVIALSVWVWIERRKNRALGSVPRSAVLARQGDEYTVQALELSDPAGECDFHIVGESNYQPELRRVAKSGRTFLAVLAPERKNPRDANAIRVCAEGGRTVGYLSRDYAIEYREVFALLEQHGRVGACRAKLIGGVGAKKSFGVMLNLKDVETILVDIRDTLAPGTAVSPNVQPF